MRKLPLLLVEWDDCVTDSRWQDVNTESGIHTNPAYSVGWRVKSNKRYLVISPMRDSTDKCDDRINIPRGCIKSIRRLE